MAILQSDGLEIEAVFQSLGHNFDAPVLTSPSGRQLGEQAVARVAEVHDDLLGLSVTPGDVYVLKSRQ